MAYRVMVVIALVVALALPAGAGAAVKPHVVVVMPFETAALDQDERWIGEGVAAVVAAGLAQHPAFVQVERTRLRAFGAADGWDEALVAKTARALHVDAALFGQIVRKDSDVVIQPRLLTVHGTSGEPATLEPVRVPPGELLARVAVLPAAYARRLHVAVSEAESARMEKAARPTTSLRAFELFARGELAAWRGDQESKETATNLLTKATEDDANFALAHYVLGTVHQSLGNRWKAAAQYRAAAQVDATYPEPYKALGDLFMSAPRRLYDQAVEAYGKAIQLRPFYADAYVGLGDARAAKGDVDGAIAAYQKALGFNTVNPRVQISLGKIYYSEKNLYYESVTAYKRAIELDPKSTEARLGLGDVYEDKGLYKEAIEQYRQVLELDPKHTGALYNLAQAYEKVDPHEAIVQWERYISLASQLPSEKDWVDVARQHLRKLKNQVKD